VSTAWDTLSSCLVLLLSLLGLIPRVFQRDSSQSLSEIGDPQQGSRQWQ
jgi:hypothetical protein